jgi:hemoglobin
VKPAPVVVACLLALVAAAPASAQPSPAPGMVASVAPVTAPSLYKRLGGYDALAAVTDDFLQRLVGDAQFARFFGGHSSDSLKKIRQHIVDQLCAATGGPCVYIGRDMKTTHAGLGIAEKDWDVSVKHLVATLDKFNVPTKEKDEVLGAIGSLKKDIVEKP